MDPELESILDRLAGLERGSPGWVNLADAFLTRVRSVGTGAPSGDIEISDELIILRGVSPTARQAFEYAAEQCETFGMEFIGPIIGYPDEAEDVQEVIRTALQDWRVARDGAVPVVIEADEGDEVPDGSEAAT